MRWHLLSLFMTLTASVHMSMLLGASAKVITILIALTRAYLTIFPLQSIVEKDVDRSVDVSWPSLFGRASTS